MKKTLPILIAVFICVFSSCKKDDETESLTNTFYPVTKGSQRVYKVTSGSSTSTYTETMTGNTSTINGLTYYEAESKQNGSDVKANSYYYEGNGVYKIRSTTFYSGITLDIEYLHESDAIGNSWIKNVTSSGKINDVPAQIVGTLKEKNISKEILGKTYKNVSHATIELQYNIGSGFETAATYQFYTAQGIGVILVESNINYFGLKVVSKTELQSYSIKL